MDTLFSHYANDQFSTTGFATGTAADATQRVDGNGAAQSSGNDPYSTVQPLGAVECDIMAATFPFPANPRLTLQVAAASPLDLFIHLFQQRVISDRRWRRLDLNR